MNIIKKSTIAFALVVGTMGFNSAQAINLDSLPSVSSANLNVTIKDGVATLFGHADSSSEKAFAEQYLAGMEEIDRVINLVTY